MTEAQRCPGNELNKNLQTCICKCLVCDKENEIFSDELNKAQKCIACGVALDTNKCTLTGKI